MLINNSNSTQQIITKLGQLHAGHAQNKKYRNNKYICEGIKLHFENNIFFLCIYTKILQQEDEEINNKFHCG